MNGNSPEEDRGLQISRAALVQAAADKAEALYARLGEITGMKDAENGETSVIKRKADSLSRFVSRHSHLLGVETDENGAEAEDEGEAAEAPAADEPKKEEVELSTKSWTVVEEAVASVILHDGKIEKDEKGSAIDKIMDENEWSRAQWDVARPALRKLGVVSLNRPGPNFTPYESVTLEMDNILAIEALIAEGKLPEYLLGPLEDIKIRKAREAEEGAGEETEASGQADEPSAEELKKIEARKEQ